MNNIVIDIFQVNLDKISGNPEIIDQATSKICETALKKIVHLVKKYKDIDQWMNSPKKRIWINWTDR